jgi:DNA polymerase-3 subunit delta'
MEHVVGQERALGIIDSALRGQRMHHAWVFHGPTGVGKATTAVALAKILLCHDAAPDLTGRIAACGSCESCRLLQSNAGGGAHPDIHVINKELAADSEFRSLRTKKLFNIPVDLLRERMIGGFIDDKYVESIVGKTAMLRHNKVFIIDEAELLDATGQNTLLKTLEEPPPGTYLFLLTAHEDRLLPTIRSRCQRVPFSILGSEHVSKWLAAYIESTLGEMERRIDDLKQKPKLSKDDSAKVEQMQRRMTQLRDPDRGRKWIQPLARGSLGLAKTVVDSGLDEWAEAVLPMVQQSAAGKAAPEFGKAMHELVEAFAVQWVEDHDNASKDAANKSGVRHMLGILGEMCRRKLHDLASKIAAGESEQVEEAARPWLGGIDLLQDAERQLESNVAIPLLLDNLAVQWAVARGAVGTAG